MMYNVLKCAWCTGMWQNVAKLAVKSISNECLIHRSFLYTT